MNPIPPSSWSVTGRPISNHDQIVRILGMEILGGTHVPGANLPAEPELLARFQVSRTVMREAVKTLTAKGLLVSRTKVGTRVLDPTHWNFFDAELLSWKVALGMDSAFRRDLLEIRQAVEPAAAALAAKRRSAADLAELRRCIQAMRNPDHTRRSFAEADLEFHLAVGAASGNPMMRGISAVIETALIASFALSSPTDQPALQQQTVERHAAIVDAIERGDSAAAATSMLAVIDAGYTRIEQVMVDIPAPSLTNTPS